MFLMLVTWGSIFILNESLIFYFLHLICRFHCIFLLLVPWRSILNWVRDCCIFPFLYRVHCMFLVLVPWGSIAVLNAWIISTLMYNTKAFKELSNSDDKVTERQKQDRQITKVLLSVTFAFLILLAWQCVNQCFFMLEFGKSKSDFFHINFLIKNALMFSIHSNKTFSKIKEMRSICAIHLDLCPRVSCFSVLFDLMMLLPPTKTQNITIKNMALCDLNFEQSYCGR